MPFLLLPFLLPQLSLGADAPHLPRSDADADAIVQRHIRLLHTYNEIKDGAQALIGRVGEDAQADADTRQYALLTNTTVTGVHRELGLSLHE